MARKETVSSVTTVNEPGSIFLTEEMRKCEELIIRANINTRPVEIGVLDFEKLVPRMWTGYIWLAHKNSIVKVEAIDFETKTIYRNTMLWKAEIPIQLAVQLINIPNAEPGTVAEQTAVFNLLTSQENNGAYYFPFPQPIDTIYYWFPAGASIDIVIDYRPWSDILNPDGSLAIPTLLNIEEDDLLEAPALGTVAPATSFLDACRATFPDNFVPDPPRKVRITYRAPRLSDGVAIQRSLAVVGESVGLVGVPQTGFGTPPAVSHWASVSSFQPCENLEPVTPTPLNRNNNVYWAIQLLEVDGVQAYVSQQVTSTFGAITIDLGSFTFEDCP